MSKGNSLADKTIYIEELSHIPFAEIRRKRQVFLPLN
jgi:hypothetical protein